MKKALITGITGQDGAYLTELLLEKGYEVHGIKRRTSLINTHRIDHLYEGPNVLNRQMIMHYGDMSDSLSLTSIIQKIQPDEIYNLAGMSHVLASFDLPEYVANVNGLGTLRMLEAIRLLGLENKTKFYQASTSELYGMATGEKQNEQTPFYPRSPYGVAKLYAHWITINYREAYKMFACNGILFNHESPVRGETFVTRKITRGIARIVAGLEERLWLGNLDAQRDWGHSKDYVRAMWLMLQQPDPEDYVIATGITTSVRDFVKMAFGYAGIEVAFTGKGEAEKVVVTKVTNEACKLVAGDVVVEVDRNYFRPTEVDVLIGDATKARKQLGWEPVYTLEAIIKEMLAADMANVHKKQVI